MLDRVDVHDDADRKEGHSAGQDSQATGETDRSAVEADDQTRALLDIRSVYNITDVAVLGTNTEVSVPFQRLYVTRQDAGGEVVEQWDIQVDHTGNAAEVHIVCFGTTIFRSTIASLNIGASPSASEVFGYVQLQLLGGELGAARLKTVMVAGERRVEGPRRPLAEALRDRGSPAEMLAHDIAEIGRPTSSHPLELSVALSQIGEVDTIYPVGSVISDPNGHAWTQVWNVTRSIAEGEEDRGETWSVRLEGLNGHCTAYLTRPGVERPITINATSIGLDLSKETVGLTFDQLAAVIRSGSTREAKSALLATENAIDSLGDPPREGLPQNVTAIAGRIESIERVSQESPASYVQTWIVTLDGSRQTLEVYAADDREGNIRIMINRGGVLLETTYTDIGLPDNGVPRKLAFLQLYFILLHGRTPASPDELKALLKS